MLPRSLVVVAGSLLTLAVPRSAHAACGWDAGLTMANHSTRPSAAFTVSWNAAPSSCGSFSLLKYRIVLNDGGTPSSPTDGIQFDAPAVNTDRNTFVYRADRLYYAKIYACDDSGCTDLLGDAEDTPTNDTDNLPADPEIWLVTGVTAASTTDYAQLGPGAASVFFYPSGWTRDDHLAMYWEDSSNHTIKYKYATSAGWQDFNNTTWLAPPVPVAQSETAVDDFKYVGHPYAFPVNDGTDDIVRLLAQNHNTGSWFPDNHVVSVDSVDDIGDDFNLYDTTCNSGGPGLCDWSGVGEVAICADGTAGCSEVDNALHGRWAWEYMVLGPPDLSVDEPMLLFSGEGDDEDDDTCLSTLPGSVDKNDILMATWDASGQEWVVTDDGSGCPEVLIADYHDPGVVPLPDGATDDFKVYAKAWNAGTLTTFYVNDLSTTPTVEADQPSPTFIFDDIYDTPLDTDCMANVDVFTYLDGSTPREGMFFDGGVSSTSYDGGSCSSGFNTGAVYFAELIN